MKEFNKALYSVDWVYHVIGDWVVKSSRFGQTVKVKKLISIKPVCNIPFKFTIIHAQEKFGELLESPEEDNQQPSSENDIKVSEKVQRLEGEESTNNPSTSAEHLINPYKGSYNPYKDMKLLNDDIV